MPDRQVARVLAVGDGIEDAEKHGQEAGVRGARGDRGAGEGIDHRQWGLRVPPCGVSLQVVLKLPLDLVGFDFDDASVLDQVVQDEVPDQDSLGVFHYRVLSGDVR